MIIPEKLAFGQTYVVQSDGPIKITQTGAHGTLVKVNVTDEDGTAGREVVFTAIDTAATVEVDKDTNWSCVPGFNRGAASVQGGTAELTTDLKNFLQWVSDGKLTFDTEGRLKIATSVDATGTINHDGYASNYTKTVDGVRYTTTVNATEVIVKKSAAGVETVLMHLHDGVLELNGARVLTEGGERLISEDAQPSISVPMQHASWHVISAATTQVSVTPAGDAAHALQMQLVYTPTELMTPEQTEAWLVGATWLYGAPMMGAGIRYVITLIEAFGEIKANATAWGGAPSV